MIVFSLSRVKIFNATQFPKQCVNKSKHTGCMWLILVKNTYPVTSAHASSFVIAVSIFDATTLPELPSCVPIPPTRKSSQIPRSVDKFWGLMFEVWGRSRSIQQNWTQFQKSFCSLIFFVFGRCERVKWQNSYFNIQIIKNSIFLRTTLLGTWLKNLSKR